MQITLMKWNGTAYDEEKSGEASMVTTMPKFPGEGALYIPQNARISTVTVHEKGLVVYYDQRTRRAA